MTRTADDADDSLIVWGELNYLGSDAAGFCFRFADVVRGLRSLDGDEVCGLSIRLGTPLSDAGPSMLVPRMSSVSGDFRLEMELDCFCVGGGPSGYICFIYTQSSPIWLFAPNGNPDDLFEVSYDCGCDTEVGVFPGTFVPTYEQVVAAARSFILTGGPSDQLRWVNQNEMGFDPW